MIKEEIENYINDESKTPLFLNGNSLEILKEFPNNEIDCIITSPPYWQKREYENGGIGLEETYNEFIDELLQYTIELKRILKDTGSFWLNLGDSYYNKNLLGIPWRIAIKMMDEQGWILRNEVIWNKVKGGMDNSKDRLGNNHEPFFHFVKKKKYFYDVDSIRSNPKTSKVVNGSVVSATGVSGVRYKRQIELSSILTDEQKNNAFVALNNILEDLNCGKLSDFRMVINKQQRTTHSGSINLSGRAKELEEKGFYFLKYSPKGSKPSDVWDILPEDKQRKDSHTAPFPEDLVRIPILATCPENGIILDPFSGTGTTNLVAFQNRRKSIGIDLSKEYIHIAKERMKL